MSDINRREHNRIPFQHRGEALIEQRLMIEIVNLSAGGMGMKTNIPLEPDSVCHLVLFQGNISVESRIVSCSKIPRRKLKYRVGVQFTKVSAQLLEEVLEMERRFKSMETRFVTSGSGDNDNPVLVTFPDNLGENEADELMEIIQTELDDGRRQFVFDFQAVLGMEESFLKYLAEIGEEVSFEDGQILLANCSSKMLSIFTVSQLDTTFPIFESVEKAMKNLRKKQPAPA